MFDFRRPGIVISFEKVELDSRVCVTKIDFSLNSKANEKFELFCQRSYDSQNLGN